jgi:hypothetical protein
MVFSREKYAKDYCQENAMSGFSYDEFDIDDDYYTNKPSNTEDL